jgi:FAD/FMN-containing dehydrogenase
MGDLIGTLNGIIGGDHVLTDLGRREYYSTDLSHLPRVVAEAVIQPANIDELSRAVRAATSAGYAVIGRGGGTSYTKGFSPERTKSVIVDMRRFNRVLEINAEDMYVTVECGCTWKTLWEALKEKGLRTPYFGPLSGMYSTIGGALSQNSLFLGSGVYNTVAESCLGIEVVLADGTVVQTGSAAHKTSNAFYRHFGPDLTGIFTADTGAFGIKTKASFRLIPVPGATEYCSFGFETLAEMLEAQIEIARLRVAAECYGFDPYYNAAFEKKGFTLRESLQLLANIGKSGKSVVEGIKGIVKTAAHGKRVLKNINYSLHSVMDGLDEAAAKSSLEAVKKICSRNGDEIPNTLPIAFRAQPFGGVRIVVLGSDGECWVPIHGFFPLSRSQAAAAATEAFFRDRADIMKKFDIRYSYLTCFSGTEFVIEPSFYWFDKIPESVLGLISGEEMEEQWKAIPENLPARQAVVEMRNDLRQLYFEIGACHLQIGKWYPYKSAIKSEGLWNLLEGVKTVVDPQRLMNPGCLGF